MDLVFILVANEEGLSMADAGAAPGEDFASYSSAAMETAQHMVQSGDLKKLICSALVLKGGQMLIMHEANIGGEQIYLTILCNKVPNGVQKLIRACVKCVSNTLLGHNDSRYHGK